MHLLVAPCLSDLNINQYFKCLIVGIYIAMSLYRNTLILKEASMKKLFMKLEEVWVAVAFAESGVLYESERTVLARTVSYDSAQLRIA